MIKILLHEQVRQKVKKSVPLVEEWGLHSPTQYHLSALRNC